MRSSSNTNRNPKFHEIKQLQYFKHLVKTKQDNQLKQILPTYIYKQYTKILDHNNYIYIPQKYIDQCQAGIPIDSSISVLSKSTILYVLSRKLHNILQYVIMKNIPVLSQLRNLDRFNILNQSIIQLFVFNRQIYRKGQQFIGIYYIIQGQVKIIHQKTGHILKIISKDNYLGLYQYYHNINYYHTTVISNVNNVRLLFIDKQCLKKYDYYDQQIRLKDIFDLYYQKQIQPNQIDFNQENIINNNRICQRIAYQDKKNNKIPLKLNVFVKKSDQFRNQTTRQDTGFNQYLRTKKVMMQLKQSMYASKIKRMNNTTLQNWPFKIQEIGRKQSKLNTNLLSCRSKLLKQNILKRLQNYQSINNQTQRAKLFCNSVAVMPIPQRKNKKKFTIR